MLALLSTPSIPLRTTISAVEVVKTQDVAICHPTEQQRRQATSTHVLAFDNNTSKLVFCESWGAFTIDEWDEIVTTGEKEKGIERLMREQVAKMVGAPTEDGP
jgi:ribonuclease PH